MKVKIFDFEHEADLEENINQFLCSKGISVKEIHYQSSHFSVNSEQIYSFSCLILYEQK